MRHRFTVKSLEVGGAEAADFAGLYGAVDIGFIVPAGLEGMAMRNQHGVIISLEAVARGVQLTLSIAGINLTLHP